MESQTTPTYYPCKEFSLKSHSGFDEAWLERLLCDHPDLLGIGENLKVVQCQKILGKGGRVDMIVENPKEQQVFIVELMLGKLDASHLVRALDYCLREQERPERKDWEFVVVLVAEHVVRTRYSRVAQLLMQQLKARMPLVFIEMSALQVNDAFTLKFTKTFDANEEEEPTAGSPGNGNGNIKEKLSPDAKEVVEQFEVLLKEIDASLSLTYRKFFIGAMVGNRVENFMAIAPKDQFTRIGVTVPEPEVWAKRLGKAGIEVLNCKEERVRFRITPDTLKKNVKLVQSLCQAGYDNWFK